MTSSLELKMQGVNFFMLVAGLEIRGRNEEHFIDLRVSFFSADQHTRPNLVGDKTAWL